MYFDGLEQILNIIYNDIGTYVFILTLYIFYSMASMFFGQNQMGIEALIFDFISNNSVR